MNRQRFKCSHCKHDMPIPVVVLVKALNEGKAVTECENCKKLNTIKSDDGEGIYIR